MISYIIELSICWLGFYLVYTLLLRRETFFQINRGYLLTTLLLGLILPLISYLPKPVFSFPEESLPTINLQAVHVGVQQLEEIVVTAHHDGIDYWQILLGIYLIGVVLFALRLFYGFYQIYQIFIHAKIIQQQNYTLVITNQIHFPFSFFNYLFWSEATPFESSDGNKIIQHEKAHMKQWHSVDVVLVELLSVLFWCSPVIYFYKKSLRVVHEYLADAEVLRHTQKKQYGQLLLRQSQSGIQLALANNFFHSQLKKRIAMMTRNKSSRNSLIKYLLAIPVLLMLLMLFSQKNLLAKINKGGTELISKNLEKQTTESKILNNILANLKDTIPLPKTHWHKTFNGEEVFKVVEEMPRFKTSECEANTDARTRKNCADREMLMFIYKNIKYPAQARELGIQGQVVVQFIVDKNGKINQPKVIRSIGGGCGEEVLRIVNTMPQWIPGKQRGKNVNVQFNLPVRFKLDGDHPAKEKEFIDEENPSAISLTQANVTALFDNQSKKNIPIFYINGERQYKFTKDLDPNLIDKIRILKDEAAIKFAGEDGKNGVILITLKPDASSVIKNQDILLIGKQANDGELFKVVEEMPYFNACNTTVESYSERKKCGDEEMLKFINKHIKYPALAKKNGVQGIVILRFIIEKDGSMSNIKLLRKLENGLDEEALRVANLMKQNKKWMPGKHRGKAVRVQFNLPIRFKLDDDGGIKNKTITNPAIVSPNLILNDFKSFPNPTDGKLSVSFTAEKAPINLSITDVTGKLVFQKRIENFDGHYNSNIDITDAANGILTLNITQNNKVFSHKLIKQ